MQALPTGHHPHTNTTQRRYPQESLRDKPSEYPDGASMDNLLSDRGHLWNQTDPVRGQRVFSGAAGHLHVLFGHTLGSAEYALHGSIAALLSSGADIFRKRPQKRRPTTTVPD